MSYKLRVFTLGIAIMAILLYAMYWEGIHATTAKEIAVNDDLESITYGEYINIDQNTPIVDDLLGNFIVHDNKNGTVDVQVKVKNSSGSLYKLYKNIPVVWNYMEYPNGHKIIIGVDLIDRNQSFYGSITMINDTTGKISISIIDDGQYTFYGFIKNPLYIKRSNDGHVKKIAMTPAKEDEYEFIKGKPVKLLTINVSDEIVYAVPDYDTSRHNKTVIMTNAEMSPAISNGIIQPNGPIMPKVCGIIEDEYQPNEREYHNIQSQVANWLRAGGMDIAIYRDRPSRSQVLSDIDYYTRIYPNDDSKTRILGAFDLEGHGCVSPGYTEPDRDFGYIDYSIGVMYIILHPEDVSATWQNHGDYYNTPDSATVYSHMCYGIWDMKDANGNPVSSDNPEMARAWVDYGAYSYTSYSIDITLFLDNFEDSFWHSLIEGQTVNSAIDAGILNQNSKDPSNRLNRGDIVVWGNGNSKLLL